MTHMTDEPSHATSDGTPQAPLPPPVKRGWSKPAKIVSCGVFVALLLLLVVFNIDTGADSKDRADRPRDLVQVEPERWSPDDGAIEEFRPEDIEFQVKEGAWIQTFDDENRLAQRYHFEASNPDPPGKPDGWVQMDQPRAEVYLADDQVITLAGDSALANLPNGQLESGTVTGNVVIGLYNLGKNELLDLSRHTPSMLVHAEEASFENFLGEVRCPDAILIETPLIELPGHDLTVWIDDQNDQVRLRMEHPEYIRFAASAEASEPDEAAQRVGDDEQRTPSESQRVASDDRASRRDERRAARRNERRADAGGAGSAGGAGGESAVSASIEAEAADFYLLTLHDNVHIRQNQRTVSGDQLTVIFSTESEGVSNVLALGVPTPWSSSRAAMLSPGTFSRLLPMPTLLSVMAFAAPQDRAETLAPPTDPERDIIITCSGALTMEPIVDPEQWLASPQDARLELTGSPIVLTDTQEQATAQCDHLVYTTLDQRLELVGSPTHPLTVASPRFTATGERFWMSQRERRGYFEGGGNLLVQDADVASIDNAPNQPAAADDNPLALEITWTDGVDLEFHDPVGDDEFGDIRTATFNGDVKAQSDTFAVDAKTLAVGFAPRDENTETDQVQIDRIEANGDVFAQGLGEEVGELESDHMVLELAQSETGQTIPKILDARGSARLSNGEETLWAEEVHATFRPVAASESAGTTANADKKTQFGDFEIDTFLATNDVELKLKDNGRVLADRITGDGIAGEARLTGNPVVLIQDNVIVDRGTEMHLSRETQRIHKPGPGRLRMFEKTISLQLEPSGRIDKQIRDAQVPITGIPDLQVDWTRSADFDGAYDDGNGVVVLRGDVQANTQQSVLEHNRVDADELTVELQKVKPIDEDAAVADAEPGADDGVVDLGGNREILKVIAKGDARIESRIWEREDRTDKPRIYHIAAEHLEYNHQTMEALADGPGLLLVQDLRPEERAGDGDAPFGMRGTSVFRWTEKMEMTHVADDIFTIVMEGETTGRHMDLHEVASTMVAERIEATVRRRLQDEPQQVAAADDGEGDAAAGLEFGGPMDVLRIRAIGGVYLDTDTRRVDCHELDYNVATGVAQILGRERRRATILTEGVIQPFRAQRIIWDVRRDTLRIDQATGAGGG